MDNRPIGVFDSGVGGLTAVRELLKLLPSEDIIYFGDTSRVPYGGRSKETIIKYARQDIAFLRSFDIKAVLVACNTVSATALEIIQDDYPLPIIGVVEASAKQAVELTKNGKIGLIGTQATISSGAYEKKIQEYNSEIKVYSKACPLFVPLVENGRVNPGDVVIETVVKEYLHSLRDEGVDVLILGCTHYPLIEEVISDFMGKDVVLINSGAASVSGIAELLRESGQLADSERPGTDQYYVSDSAESFEHIAALFLHRDITGKVQKTGDIEKFCEYYG